MILLTLEAFRFDALDATAGQLNVDNFQSDERAVSYSADCTIIDVEEINLRLGGETSHRRQQLLVLDYVALHREIAGQIVVADTRTLEVHHVLRPWTDGRRRRDNERGCQQQQQFPQNYIWRKKNQSRNLRIRKKKRKTE